MPSILLAILIVFIIMAAKMRKEIHGRQYLYLLLIISSVFITMDVIFSIIGLM